MYLNDECKKSRENQQQPILVFFDTPSSPTEKKKCGYDTTRDAPREKTSTAPEGSKKKGNKTSRFLLGYLEK